jgi:hypothetical protein
MKGVGFGLGKRAGRCAVKLLKCPVRVGRCLICRAEARFFGPRAGFTCELTVRYLLGPRRQPCQNRVMGHLTNRLPLFGDAQHLVGL